MELKETSHMISHQMRLGENILVDFNGIDEDNDFLFSPNIDYYKIFKL